MGKQQQRRFRRDKNKFKKKGGDEIDPELAQERAEKKRQEYEQIKEYNNEHFNSYYQAQGIVPAGEWPAFVEALKRPLPVTFRVNNIGFQEQIMNTLRAPRKFGLAETANPLVFQGEAIPPPEPLPWYPNQEAWYYKISKQDLRRVPETKEMRDFLIMQDTQGNITRQEAVSMIPPLLLEAQPDHWIIDMCAAPGSKTAQLLSALHSDARHMQAGMVLANDADPKRAYMLVHQLKRLGSANFLVTTHEGQFFPNLRTFAQGAPDSAMTHLFKSGGASAAATPAPAAAPAVEEKGLLPKLDTVRFDRVLCDVPCSGDGTLRKNLLIWKNWNPHHGIGLHALQILIAVRGFQLLKPGGRMVYSTCSFNPIENEAVVAELLRRFDGHIELLDSSDKLPGLVRTPGMKTWKFQDKNSVWYNSYSEVPRNRLRIVKPTCFPPTEDEQKRFPLERCLRVLPHHQDTGGFFIAVLTKTSEPPRYPPNVNPVRALGLVAPASSTSAAAAAGDGSTVAGVDNAATSSAAGAPDDTKEDPEDVPMAVNADGEMVPIKMDVDVNVDMMDAVASEPQSAVPAPAVSASTAAAAAGGADSKAEQKAGGDPRGNKRRREPEREPSRKQFEEDPFLPISDELWQSIQSFYKLSPEVPRQCFFSRSDEDAVNKRIYFLAPAIADIIQLRETINTRLKVVHSGLKAFERVKQKHLPCAYRLCQESLYAVGPFVNAQRLQATAKDVKVLLQKGSVRLMDISDHIFYQQTKAAELGGCVIVYQYDATQRPMMIAALKSESMLSLLLSKQEKVAYLNLVSAILGEPVVMPPAPAGADDDAEAGAAAGMDIAPASS